MDKIKVGVQFGTIDMRTFNKFEGGRMVTYNYSIRRDIDGKEISRTSPEAGGSIGFTDGTPFTKADYEEYING